MRPLRRAAATASRPKFTRAVRDLSERFEHRLFLSATPHNGHSNSSFTLLELLDPYRFTRGVKVHGRRALEDVMVRRLKEDVRRLQGGFPMRNVKRLEMAGLPPDAPEIVLSQLLAEYRTACEERHAQATAKQRAVAGLLVVGLQQRLLSSIEAFARSLAVHRETVQHHWDRQEQTEPSESVQASSEAREPGGTTPGRRTVQEAQHLFLSAPGADDEHERDEWTEEQAEQEERRQIEVLTEIAESEGVLDQHGGATSTTWPDVRLGAERC